MTIQLEWGSSVWPEPENPSFGPYNQDGLEIGGGPHPLRPRCRQFDAIDWQQRTGCAYDIGDARSLPYEDESFDYVFASNLLEHFPPDETTVVLTEWTRVLRVGGWLELVVPDAMGILRDHFSGRQPWPNTQERLLGSQDYPGNQHLTCFTLGDFPAVLARVLNLRLDLCEHSHSGGGIHTLSVKL